MIIREELTMLICDRHNFKQGDGDFDTTLLHSHDELVSKQTGYMTGYDFDSCRGGRSDCQVSPF